MMRAFIFILILTAIAPLQMRAEESDHPDIEQQKENAQSTLWKAYILRRKAGNAFINGLKFSKRELPVTLVSREGKLRPLIEIHGSYEAVGWRLFAQNGFPVQVSPDRNEFKIFAYLNARINEVVLQAKGPNNQIETETIYVYAPNAQEFEVVSSWDRVLLSLGPTILNYTQSNYGNIRALTAMLSAQYSTPPDRTSPWGFNAAVDMTSLLFLASRSINTSPNVIEAKLDALYRLTPNRERTWHFQAIGGLGYLTMLSNGSPFGFTNLLAPDLGVRIRRLLNKKNAIISEIRYLPLKLNTTDRGLSISLSLSRILSNYHRFEMGLYMSDYDYLDGDSQVKPNLVTLKFGYSL